MLKGKEISSSFYSFVAYAASQFCLASMSYVGTARHGREEERRPLLVSEGGERVYFC